MKLLSRLLTVQNTLFSEPPIWSRPDSGYWMERVGEIESIGSDFAGYVKDAYKANGVIFACILARLMVFSEARFAWQRMENGRAGELFTDEALALIDRPWPNATTGHLLARMEQDASLAGNFYATPRGQGSKQRIRRLSPQWVTVVTGSPTDDPFHIDAELAGYIYHPKGPRSVGTEPVILTPAEVIHYAPLPDPGAQWRGQSWLTPVINEIKADKAATKHKLKFFENSATPGLRVTYDKEVSPESFKRFVAAFEENHPGGVESAYKTIHLGGGADVKAMMADFQQLEFKATQGAGETRIASAAGVHPVILGLSEGMQGSSLNVGNFGAARRRFSDGTIRPLLRIAAAALESITTRPENTRLWYDDRDVPFFREDAKEEAEIRSKDAATLKSLVDSGFTPDSSVEAVRTGDFSKLEHTGLFSVQLQPAGSTTANNFIAQLLVENGYTPESAHQAVITGDYENLARQTPSSEETQNAPAPATV